MVTLSGNLGTRLYPICPRISLPGILQEDPKTLILTPRQGPRDDDARLWSSVWHVGPPFGKPEAKTLEIQPTTTSQGLGFTV